jgi:hypothetical protein
MRNFIITVAWVLVGLFLWELFIVPLANRIDVDKKEKEEIACYWCFTLVDGHCRDDTNWSKWCYNNFEWERPENDYYD